MEMTKGKHVHKISFRVTDQELTSLREKMKQAGIDKPSVYIRKMVLDGYVLTLSMPELKELISLMRYSSNNLNQIAKKANETGTVTAGEVKEIQDEQERLWNGINRILRKLGEIP